MAKYFMNDEIYYQGKKQPPRKEYVYLDQITVGKDGFVSFIGVDGNRYSIEAEMMLEDDTPIKRD